MTAVAWPGQQDLATELAQRAAEPTTWPGFGHRSAGPLRLIVVADQRSLDSLARGRAPSWGAAIAVPTTRTVVLRADTREVYRTLRHELAHLILHQAVPVRVPLWFDEGYAAWAAGEWERLGALELNVAVVRGKVPDLRGLDGALRGSTTTADAAYALATSAVTELARRNPTGSIAPLLRRLEQGQDFASAVQATTGLSLTQFDGEWRRALRRRYSLGNWLLAGGGWGLLSLVVWALLRRRRAMDRPRRAALDQGWEVPPEDVAPSELDRTKEP